MIFVSCMVQPCPKELSFPILSIHNLHISSTNTLPCSQDFYFTSSTALMEQEVNLYTDMTVVMHKTVR